MTPATVEQAGRHAPATASPLTGFQIVHSGWSPAGRSMTVRVEVRGDDPYLRGHFPGLAILPGVFVVEALCQALACGGWAEPGRPPALSAVRSARFLAPLLAGDALTLEIAGRPRPGGWQVTAEGRRADGTVSARIRADFTLPEAADA